jgi:IclR family pca regulon transcriptional regulator
MHPDSPTHATPAPEPRNTDHVQSLERGLAVIRAFTGEVGPLSLSEVAQRCDLTRAAARRFLLTLVNLGYVAQDGREFVLRPRVLELGVAYLSGLEFLDVARPHLEAVSHAVDESASIAVLDGDDMVYVARVPTRRIMSVTIANGTRFPAHTTSMGRVLLAALPPADADAHLARVLAGAPASRKTPKTVTGLEDLTRIIAAVRRTGHAVVDEELELGLRSVAVPIADGRGTTVAAMNVATHAARRSVRQLETDVLPHLLRGAEAIETDLLRLRATTT